MPRGVLRGVSRELEHGLERDLERMRHLEGSSQLCLGHLELRPSPVSFLCQRALLPVRADEFRLEGLMPTMILLANSKEPEIALGIQPLQPHKSLENSM